MAVLQGSASILWVGQAILGVMMGLGGFTMVREFGRNDDQEIRLRMVEQAVVEIQFIRRDVSETRANVDKLMERGCQ